MHLEESSRSMTAFITPFGVYEWKVLPMGVKVGPQVFQRLVAWVVRNWMTDVGTKRFPGPHEPGRPGANNTQSPPTTPVGRACSACMCACTGRRPGAIASHRGIFEARVPQVGVHVELRVGDVCQPDLIELGLGLHERGRDDGLAHPLQQTIGRLGQHVLHGAFVRGRLVPELRVQHVGGYKEDRRAFVVGLHDRQQSLVVLLVVLQRDELVCHVELVCHQNFLRGEIGLAQRQAPGLVADLLRGVVVALKRRPVVVEEHVAEPQLVRLHDPLELALMVIPQYEGLALVGDEAPVQLREVFERIHVVSWFGSARAGVVSCALVPMTHVHSGVHGDDLGVRRGLAQQPCRLPSVHPTFKNVFGLQRFGDKPAPEGVREPHAERVHADGAVRVDVVDKLLEVAQQLLPGPWHFLKEFIATF
mmetsp:Transcript_76587/g.127581  ORF Transcript_76587/g.127581 Transcript_76587/m.127581 type:complete len:419 (-) Transcript_76587:133-1389(-)